jgi:hypothetical protein
MVLQILGEYKTLEQFWSEAVHTACYVINRLYLHCLLKKTSYELLTDNKPVTPGFWKANRMRTMYVPGSELTYTAIT